MGVFVGVGVDPRELEPLVAARFVLTTSSVAERGRSVSVSADRIDALVTSEAFTSLMRGIGGSGIK
jgi:hypothetical protein